VGLVASIVNLIVGSEAIWPNQAERLVGRTVSAEVLAYYQTKNGYNRCDIKRNAPGAVQTTIETEVWHDGTTQGGTT